MGRSLDFIIKYSLEIVYGKINKYENKKVKKLLTLKQVDDRMNWAIFAENYHLGINTSISVICKYH